MIVTDYIAEFLQKQGIKKAFGIIGSANAPLFHSFDAQKGIEIVCVQHEQAASMAADAYAKVSGRFGVAVSTSGPGALNLATGVACSWFDSIPVLLFTGQVNSEFTKGDLPIKHIGFQETDVVSIYKPITKYAVMVTDPKKIRYELEKAVHLATTGRPGPVLIDLPMDIQKAEIKEFGLVPYKKPKGQKLQSKSVVRGKIHQYIRDFKKAKRPVILVGGGVVLAQVQEDLKKVLNKLRVPVTLTWAAIDAIEEDSTYYRGRIGTYGQRFGNFTFQNSDLILFLGSRHDGRQTGGRVDSFGRVAKRYMVDIDKDQLDHALVKNHVSINADLRDFLPLILEELDKEKLPRFDSWLKETSGWMEKYPILQPEYTKLADKVNGYNFFDALSQVSEPNDVVVGDCGGNIVYLAQGIKLKRGQKVVTSWAHSPMGYAFAASMGAYFGKNSRVKNVICTVGDGGMQVNIQELQTFKEYNIPVKVFVLNNYSYGIIKQYQDIYYDSNYVASGRGYGVPDFIKVAKAYGLPTETIRTNGELKNKIKRVLKARGPVICEVQMPELTELQPRLHGWNIEPLDSTSIKKRQG